VKPLDQAIKHRVHIGLVRNQFLEQARVHPRSRDGPHAQQRVKSAHLAQLRVPQQFPPQTFHAVVLENDARDQTVPDGPQRVIIPLPLPFRFQRHHERLIRQRLQHPPKPVQIRSRVHLIPRKQPRLVYNRHRNVSFVSCS